MYNYGFKKEFWHKGIVTEAGMAVIEQLKKDDISYITATHDVNNQGSGRVMKRLGMNYQYSYGEQWQLEDLFVIFRMYQLNFDGDDNRVYKENGQEVESGIVEPSWIEKPLDTGTNKVLSDGYKIVIDKKGYFVNLTL